MSTMNALSTDPVEKAEQLDPEVRAALRNLILTLADNKRLLGIRYSDWMLGSPTLETGIAASSMAQDEWGHARLTYALLSDFGEEPKALEHEREADGYHSMEALDRPFSSWIEMIAAALTIDTALAEQYRDLVGSRYTPVRNRVQKLLDEEEFHSQYAAGWARRLAESPGSRGPFVEALRRLLPQALRWAGRAEDPAATGLVAAGVIAGDADRLRVRLLQRIGPVLAESGISGELGLTSDGSAWTSTEPLVWDGWSDTRRRAEPGGPDAETLARARGDKNRAMLLD